MSCNLVSPQQVIRIRSQIAKKVIRQGVSDLTENLQLAEEKR